MTAYRSYPLPRAYRRVRRYPYRYRKAGGNGALPIVIAGVVLAAGAGTGVKAVTRHHAAPAAHAPAPADGNAAAAQVIAFARAQLGKPYVYGATGPEAFDCSGLVMKAYAAAGITIARTSQQQWATLPHVPPGQVRPGDLVFFPGIDGTFSAPGHVALVISKTEMIQAYATGTPIEVSPLNGDGAGGIVGFARPQAPASPKPEAAPGPGEAGFIAAVLAGLGAPDTTANRDSFLGWFPREYPSWPAWAQWNPMSSTMPMPGAWAYNTLPGGLHVWNYPNAAEGAQATAATLNDGWYPAIVAALRSGAGICGGGFANELSTWSGGGYTEVC